MTQFIRNWDELKAIPNESETHTLKVGKHNAWLNAKIRKKYDDKVPWIDQVKHLDVYLSTHTFYGSNYKQMTEVLQRCGFDVELANWDA